MLPLLLVQWIQDERSNNAAVAANAVKDMTSVSTMPASQQAGTVHGIWGLVCWWQV